MNSSLTSLASRSVVTLIGVAQSCRIVLQDFTPLAESLEWHLGSLYLARRGSLAFLSDPVPVPYAVNNSGALSRHAAELLFAALLAAERDLRPLSSIVVLELGIGLGLFARYFLDAFHGLCTDTGKDYYHRLTYVAADSSERMLLDAVRRGTFQHHPGRYILRVIDALDPQAGIRADPVLTPHGDRPFHAVFLNYLLDCLPASVLRPGEEPVTSVAVAPSNPSMVLDSETTTPGTDGEPSLRRLCVRTILARGVDLHEYTDDTPEDLARLAASPNPTDRQRLLDLFGLFASEYDYRPVRNDDLPYGQLALDFVRRQRGTVVHSHGALTCLERLLSLLHPDGFVLVNDYGSADGATADDFEHQRYTGSTFVGVNFALLQQHFTGKPPDPPAKPATDNTESKIPKSSGPSPEIGPTRWVAPNEDSGRIYSRLLGHDLPPALVALFRERFAKPAWDRLDEPIARAKQHASQLRYEAAAAAYRTALERQPTNWLLLLEVANFLTFGLRDAQTGLEIARAGLSLNLACSAELWNAYGDALFSLGRIADSRRAFDRALAINPEDIQARYNLAWVHLHRKEHADALRVLAEALVRDWRGEWRERLLHKQAEVLQDLARRSRQEFQTLVNRVIPAPGHEPPKTPTAPASRAGPDAPGRVVERPPPDA